MFKRIKLVSQFTQSHHTIKSGIGTTLPVGTNQHLEQPPKKPNHLWPSPIGIFVLASPLNAINLGIVYMQFAKCILHDVQYFILCTIPFFGAPSHNEWKRFTDNLFTELPHFFCKSLMRHFLSECVREHIFHNGDDNSYVRSFSFFLSFFIDKIKTDNR